MHVVLFKRLASALFASPLLCAAAPPAATVTLLEGDATLVRGAARYALAEGVRLQPGDIVEVPDSALAQLEYADGAALALGPRTRLLTVSAPAGKSAQADYYVMQGVLKLTGVKKGSRFRFATPALTVQPQEGSAVLLIGGAEGSVFAESGETRLVGGSTTLRLTTGDFGTRRHGQKPSAELLPPKSFVAALPPLFLDPLPSRLAHYKGPAVEPRRLEEVRYGEVEAWLKAPPAIRKPLVARFEPRASDAAFRAGLVANLKFHPEWRAVLYPVAKEAPSAEGGYPVVERSEPAALKSVPAP